MKYFVECATLLLHVCSENAATACLETTRVVYFLGRIALTDYEYTAHQIHIFSKGVKDANLELLCSLIDLYKSNNINNVLRKGHSSFNLKIQHSFLTTTLSIFFIKK